MPVPFLSNPDLDVKTIREFNLSIADQKLSLGLHKYDYIKTNKINIK